MSTLYRKYRPQTFSEVFGQSHIKKTIENELKTDKTAHAYLFCGPRGIGKTTMARLLAKSVNCLNRELGSSEPCNKCDACQEIMKSKSLDVIEIDAASHTGVDHVREHIIDAARFVPTNRKYKIFIIDEVHMLSTSAFNALLKILEEPPEYVKFVLATTEIHKILPTIISRCQRFDFTKISYPELKERLNFLIESEGKKVDEKVVDMVIAHSDGCLRDAESLLGQVLTLDDQHITIDQASLVLPITNYGLVNDFLQSINNGDIHNAIGQVNLMSDKGVNIEQFNKDLIEFLRKILLYKIHGGLDEYSAELDEGLQKNIIELAGDFELKNIIKMIDIFINALQNLKTAPIIQLPIELAVVELLELKFIEKKAKNPEGIKGTKTNITKKIVENIKEAQISENPKENKFSEQINEQKSDADLNLDSIIEKWNQVNELIEKKAVSLSIVMSAGIPQKFEGNLLTIAFRHSFNQKKIADIENRGIIEAILYEVYQSDVKVESICDQSIEACYKKNDSISLGEVFKMNRDHEIAENQPEAEDSEDKDKSESKKKDNDLNKVLDIFGGAVVE